LLIPALIMLFPSVWLMGIISSAFAIHVDFVVNLLLCLSVFLLGLISQYIVTNFLGDSFFANCVGSIVPNWQFFWMADALVN